MMKAICAALIIGTLVSTCFAQITNTDTEFPNAQWQLQINTYGAGGSVTALQMYQRARRGPIDGPSAVNFLLFDETFPRSVLGTLQRIKSALGRLPQPDVTLPSVAVVESLLATLHADIIDGAALDQAMDQVQLALADIHSSVYKTFFRGPR